jgi:signal peptidase II
MSLVKALTVRWPYFLIAAGVLALDQITKALAHQHLRGTAAVEIIPGLFNLAYSRNRGGLFGYFSDLTDPWRTVLLTLLPLVAIVLIGFFIVRSEHNHPATRVGLGLILGGAVGNLIDRVLRGEVIDFLDVYASSDRLASWLIERFGTAHWPTFNVADSAIVVGAGLLILDLFRSEPGVEKNPPESIATASGNHDAS